MATLDAIKRQIAKLEAEVVRKTKGIAGAISKVHAIMTAHGLTIEQLTSSRPTSATTKAVAKNDASRKTNGKRAGAGIPKYRDPATDATWTGFGRAPRWIESAKSRDAFLIEASESKDLSRKTAAAKKAVGSVKPVRTKALVASVKKTTSKKTKATAKAPAVNKTVAKKAAAEKVASARKLPAKPPTAKKQPGAKKATRKARAPAKASSPTPAAPSTAASA